MITKRTLLPLLTLSFLLSITSCKNFMSGSDILNELQDAIAYTNAESFNVIVEADSVLGKISDSGKKEVKVKDKLSLSFEVNSEKHVFLGWTCVKAESGEDASANVEFEDILSPKTTVKFLKPGDVTIKPKCAERPYVKNFSPTYDQTGVGVAKNTSIIIEFAQKIETSETENILNKIIIESNGAVTSKFSPSMSEKIITIVSKELIDLKNGTQDVTVKVPGSYYYTTKDVKGNNVKVYLSPAYNGENEVYDAHSYLINSTTSEKTEIYFSVDTELGKLDYTGQKTLNVGDEFQVTFTNNKGYSFKNWNITADGYTEDELKTSLGIETSDNTDSGKYTISGTVTKSIKGIKISPICNELPTVKDYTPKMEENGVLQDSSIKIYFSKPINLADFYTKETGFKNLSIMAGGVEVACNSDSSKNRFSSANYTETKNADGETVYVLTIIPDNYKLLISSTNENEKLDVIVTVYTKTNKIKDSSEAPELFTDDITWSYRVKNVRDGEAPTNFSINVYNDENCTKELYSDCFDSNGNIFDNNHVNKIYIKAEAKDNTGVAGLYVTEKYLKDRDGNTQDQNDPNNSKSYLVGTDELKQDSKDKNKYTLFIPYIFNNPNDGEYEIIFSMVDYAENHSEEKSVTLIKDTINTCEFNIVSGMEINFPSNQYVTSSTISKTNLVKYSYNKECVIKIVGIAQNIGTSLQPKYYFQKTPTSEQWYKYTYNNARDLKWYILYDYDLSYSNKLEIDSNSYPTIKFSSEFPEKNLYIKVVAEDLVGNTTVLEKMIPQKPIVKKAFLKRGKYNYDTQQYDYSEEGKDVILCVETEPLSVSLSDTYSLFIYYSNTEETFKTPSSPSTSNFYEQEIMSFSEYESNYINNGKNIEFYCFYGQDQFRNSQIANKEAFDRSVCGFVSDCNPAVLVTSTDYDSEVPEIDDDNISCNITSNGINSKTYKIKIGYDSDYLYNDIAFSWAPKNGGKPYYLYFKRYAKDSEVYGYKYYYELLTDIPTEVFYDKNNKARIDYTFKFIARKDKTEKETSLVIAKDDERIIDNIPPSYTSFNQESSPLGNYIRIGSFSEPTSGIKKISIYYAPLQPQWRYSSSDETPETNCYLGGKVIEQGLITEQYILENFSHFDTTVKSNVTIDTSEIEDGDYLLCAYAEDLKGNYILVPLQYYFKNKCNFPSKPTVSMNFYMPENSRFVLHGWSSGSSYSKYSNISFNSHILNQNDACNLYGHTCEVYKENNWTSVSSSATGFEYFTTSDDKELSLYPITRYNIDSKASTTDMNVFEPYFIRINMILKYYSNKPNGKKASSPYKYYYTGIKMEDNQVKDDDGNPITITADMIDTARGGMIYSSHPCMIETVYSSKDWGNDPDEWEYHVPDSQKVDIVVFKPTAENQQYLYSINKTEDMKGKYCRVLVHFADGTSVLSSLK